MLIPAITEGKCNPLDRSILALPVRLGSLGLGNPSLEAGREYASSVKVTKPLVKQIESQGAFHLSELTGQATLFVTRISLLIKAIQPDQSNPK